MGSPICRIGMADYFNQLLASLQEPKQSMLRSEYSEGAAKAKDSFIKKTPTA